MTGRPQRFRTGELRHRCTIQQPTETLAEYGQPVVTWSDLYADEPCKFEPTGGIESMRGRQYEATTKAVFTVRYRPNYTPLLSVLFNGVRYGILHVNPVDGMSRYLELVCGSVA